MTTFRLESRFQQSIPRTNDRAVKLDHHLVTERLLQHPAVTSVPVSPKTGQIEKPTRKRRRDAKYRSHSERQRAYQARRPISITRGHKVISADKGRKGQSDG
jgi:hypothetical protein